MAQQTLTIGTATSSSTVSLTWQPPASPRLIDAAFVSGGGTAYLRTIILHTDTSFASTRIRTSDSDSNFGTDTGPELTTAWEQNVDAVTIRAGTLSITLRGPNATGVTTADDTEPYSWAIPSAEATALGTFITAYTALTDAQKAATTLTFSDELLPQELSVNVDHDGESTFSAELTYHPEPTQSLAASLSTSNTSTFSAQLTYEDVPDPLTLDDLNLEDGETVRLGFVIQLESAINFSDSNQIIYNRRTTETNVGTIVAGDTEIDSAILADGDPTTNIERFRVRTTGGIVGGRVGFNDDSDASLSAINSNYAGILRVVIVTKDISAGTTRRIEEAWSDIYAGGGGTFMNMNTLISSSGELWGGSSASTPLQEGDQVLVGWIQLADYEIQATLDTSNTSTFSATLTYEEGEDQEIEATLSTSNTSTFSATLTYEAFVATEQTFTIGAPTSEQNSAGNYILNWQPPDSPRLLESLLVGDRSTAYLRRFQIRTTLNERHIDVDHTDSDSDIVGPNLSPSWEENSTALILEAGDLTLTLRGPNASGVTFADTQEPYVWNVAAEAESVEDFFEGYFALSQAQQDATTLTFRDTPGPLNLRAELDHDGTSTLSAELTYHAVPANEQVMTIGAPTTGDSSELFWNPPASPRLIDAAFVSGGVTAHLRRFHLYTSGNNEVVELRSASQDTGSGIEAGPELRPAWEQNTYALVLEAGNLSLTIGGPNSSGVGTTDSSEPYAWFYATGDLDLSAFFTAYDALSQAEKDATTLTFRDSIPDMDYAATLDHDGTSTFVAELTYRDADDQELEASITHSGQSTFSAELTYEAGEDQELSAQLDHDGQSSFAAELTYGTASDQELSAELSHTGQSTFAAELSYLGSADQELAATLDHNGQSTFAAELSYLASVVRSALAATLNTANTSMFSVELTYEQGADQELAASLSTSNTSTFAVELTYESLSASLAVSDLNIEDGETVVMGFVFQLETAIVFSSANQVIYNRRPGETPVGTLVAGDEEIDASILADGDPETDITRVRFRTSGGVFGRRIGFNDSTTASLGAINSTHGSVLRIVVVTKDISDGTTRRAERAFADAHGGSGGSFLNQDLDISAPEDLWAGSDGTTPIQAGDQVLVGWVRLADYELAATLNTSNTSTFAVELTYEDAEDTELAARLNTSNTSTFSATLTYHAAMVRQLLEAQLDHDGQSTFAAELTNLASTVRQELEAQLDHDGTSSFAAELTYEQAPDQELEASLSTSSTSTFNATLTYHAAMVRQNLAATLDHDGTSTFSAELTYEAVAADQELAVTLDHDGQSTFAAELTYEIVSDQELSATLDHSGTSTFSTRLINKAVNDQELTATLDHDGVSTFSVEVTSRTFTFDFHLSATLWNRFNTITASLDYVELADQELSATLDNDGVSSFEAALVYNIRRGEFVRPDFLAKNLFAAAGIPFYLIDSMFHPSNKETVELRVYSSFATSRGYGEAESLPTYDSYNIDVVVVPIKDAAPTENVAGRAGRADLLQEGGGKRTQSTLNFLVNPNDVTFERTALSAGLVKIIYQSSTWNVESLETYPAVSQLTGTTEF